MESASIQHVCTAVSQGMEGHCSCSGSGGLGSSARSISACSSSSARIPEGESSNVTSSEFVEVASSPASCVQPGRTELGSPS